MSPAAQSMEKSVSTPRVTPRTPAPKSNGFCCCFGSSSPPEVGQGLGYFADCHTVQAEEMPLTGRSDIETAGRRTQQRLDKLMNAEAQLTARTEAERVKQVRDPVLAI